jgi:hypothetical protein
MLNKMSILLAATAAVALSTGVAVAQPDRQNASSLTMTVGDSSQAGYGNGYNYGYDDGMARRDRDARYRAETYRAQPVGLISLDLNNIAFGYQDGYWDNSHAWHKWSHKNDYRAYRARSGSHYYAGNHDRYRNAGWQR